MKPSFRKTLTAIIGLLSIITLSLMAVAEGSTDYPEVSLVTLDVAPITAQHRASDFERTVRSLDGVTSVTLRGSTAGVTFRTEQLTSTVLVDRINAAGLGSVALHTFDQASLAKKCPLPSGLHSVLKDVRDLFTR